MTIPISLAKSRLDLGLKPGPVPSKVCGGTSEELGKEIEKASFNIETMTNCFDGSAELTARRRWIQKSTQGYQAFVLRDVKREEVMEEHLRHFSSIHDEFTSPTSKYRPTAKDFHFMFQSRVLNGALSIHYSLFLSTLRSQASDEQLGWWLDKVLRIEIIGCYAQVSIKDFNLCFLLTITFGKDRAWNR